MDQKSPRRPPTPKRTGQTAIRRDQNVDELVMKFREQELGDKLSPHDGRNVRKSAKRDKSPRRSQTPKREQDGPHGIVVDKNVEKAVKNIHKKLHPQDHPKKGIFGAKRVKSPKRPSDTSPKSPSDTSQKRAPTPMRVRIDPNTVLLDENTKKGVQEHLEANDPFFRPERIQPDEEVGGAKPKKGQVSPKSPQPQPGPLFPTEGATKPIRKTKKSDSKYTIQEALLTAHIVGSVVVPTAEAHIEQPKGFSKFIQTLSFKKKKSNEVSKETKPVAKPKDKSEELVSDLSTTDTSVHTSLYSTSLPSDLFEDRSSDTYTQSTVTPALDMTPTRLARLSEERDSLTDSFPSEVEGAVGGEDIETFTEDDERSDPDIARGRVSPVKGERELYYGRRPNDDDREPPVTKIKYTLFCSELARPRLEQDYYESYRGRFPRRTYERTDSEDSEESARRFFKELDCIIGPFDGKEPYPWRYDEKFIVPESPERDRRQGGGRNDGGYDALYVRKPNVMETVPGSSSRNYDRSYSADSESERESLTSRALSSRRPVAEIPTGPSWVRESTSFSDASSDSDPELDF